MDGLSPYATNLRKYPPGSNIRKYLSLTSDGIQLTNLLDDETDGTSTKKEKILK